MSELGAAVGVRTTAIDALVTLACVIAGTDFAGQARTLERLGLAGMDASGIRTIVAEGFG
jgi:hypothetical protein